MFAYSPFASPAPVGSAQALLRTLRRVSWIWWGAMFPTLARNFFRGAPRPDRWLLPIRHWKVPLTSLEVLCSSTSSLFFKLPLVRHALPLLSTNPLTPQTGLPDLPRSQCPSPLRVLPATRRNGCARRLDPSLPEPHDDQLLAVSRLHYPVIMPKSKTIRRHA